MQSTDKKFVLKFASKLLIKLIKVINLMIQINLETIINHVQQISIQPQLIQNVDKNTQQSN